MSRFEIIVVGLFIGVTCPLLLFVLFWWTAAAISMHIVSLPVNAVIIAAFTGLGIGILLDIAFLKRWIKRFYTANIYLMTGVYLALSAIAVTFFMGLPVGTFILGIATGIYLGRRQHHLLINRDTFSNILRVCSLFTAFITAAAALPIGLMALGERGVAALIETILGLNGAAIEGAIGYTLVGIACIILFVFQYHSTKTAGRIASGS